jgi:DNA-binding transcriptional ArsR family regulator
MAKMTIESIQAMVAKAEEKKAKALEKAEAEAAKELEGLGEELTAQHTSSIEGLRNLERMMRTAGVSFKSVFGGKRGGGGGTGKTRGSGKDSVRGRMILFLSSKGEATVDEIHSALKLGDEQRKGLGVALSVAKKDGLTDKGGERGSWKITAKGKEAAKEIKTAD